ncbi:16S rRNA (cytidine(1402)-2'-O)-methyltransferase [Candidatus Gracilibacteria bacterium]|nr:16S rRNA (cytidine(1402)-2'-O)-methyltransferase [Candidatus Gracilibacteria bacterium]
MLYFVPTPIGNLKDITLRALEVLQSVDLILCENPHHSQKLLQAHQIAKPTRQCNQFANEQLFASIASALSSGQSIAYISDAGMPGISDPGSELISFAIQNKLPFTVLPGANACLPTLVASGFLRKEFYFAGFLPLKKGRKTQISKLLVFTCPVVLYESPYRINKLLAELVAVGAGNRQVMIGRELTKMYEEYIHGSAEELAVRYQDKVWKGELVVVIDAIS